MESSQESSLHQQLEQMELLLETIQEYCDENGQIIAKKVKSLFQSTINRVLTNEQIQNIFHAEVDDESIGVIGTISEHHIIEIIKKIIKCKMVALFSFYLTHGISTHNLMNLCF